MSNLISMRLTATILGVSRKTVMLLIARGKLKGLKVGRQWRFDPADVEAFIETQKAAATPARARTVPAPLLTTAARGRSETKWKGADRYLKH